MRRAVLASLAASLLVGTVAAHAEDALPGPKDDAIVTLGGGLRVNPDWDGAKKAVLAPFPIIGLKFMRSPFTGQPSSDTGIGIAPSFRYHGKRHFDGSSVLFGLHDVAATFEAGLTVDYTDTNFRAFVTGRQAMGGVHGQIFEIGVDGIYRPVPKLKLEGGPRVSFATADYVRGLYGVSAGEAAATGVAAYSPSGGFRSAGLGGKATWDFDKRWFARLDAEWTHFGTNVTDSPIIKAEGRRDQFTVGIGIGYRFGVGWH